MSTDDYFICPVCRACNVNPDAIRNRYCARSEKVTGGTMTLPANAAISPRLTAEERELMVMLLAFASMGRNAPEPLVGRIVEKLDGAELFRSYLGSGPIDVGSGEGVTHEDA